jgi:hypothetical protein
MLIVAVTFLSACSQDPADHLTTSIAGEAASGLVLRDSMPAPSPIGVVFGSSYGMCEGYCRHEYTLHSWGIVGVRWARPLESEAKPEQTIWARLHSERVDAVVAQIDTMDLGRSYEVIGCGDCKDGGACWLKVERPGRTKTLSFECVGGAGPYDTLMVRLWRLIPSLPDNTNGPGMPGLPRWE